MSWRQTAFATGSVSDRQLEEIHGMTTKVLLASLAAIVSILTFEVSPLQLA